MQTESKVISRFRYRPLQVLKACAASIGLGVVVALCWSVWSFILSPTAASIIMLLACLGMPGAYLVGRWQPCANCQEREDTVRLLEGRIIYLLRQQDRLRVRLHEALYRLYRTGRFS